MPPTLNVVARPDLALMMFDFAVSGVVRNAIRIAGAAAEAGLRVELWTARDGGEMRAQVPSGVAVRSFGVHLAGTYSRSERRSASLGAVPALAAALAEHRPRIACSAGNHFHATAVRARLSLPASDVRLIGRVSNALPRFSWNPAQLPVSLWKRVAARWRLGAMDRLVTVSQALATDLQHQLLLPSEKIVVIPNGIDLAATQQRAAEGIDHAWLASGEPPVVLGVGRLVRQKNFDGLIRAFALARKAMPLRLLILGDGTERQSLESLARKLGVDADVQFAGYVAEPLPYFVRAALFVLPSRWEGMSNALLEAMAVGCPVLATRCPGTVEVLGTGLQNRLVKLGDDRAFAERIIAMLRDPGARNGISERAAEFDLSRTLQTYVDLFGRELERAA